jgi:transposase
MRMASSSIAHQTAGGVTVGVDTHGEVHVAAAFTGDLGRPLGHLEVPTTPTGYRRLLRWAQGLGDPTPRFGLEGTGSYGAGLARHLRRAGCSVIEVNRPNRQTRHARGKSDPVDAEAAARAVLSGEAAAIPKCDEDRVGMIRTLRVARRSAVQSTTQVANQIKALIVTAPAELREQLRSLTGGTLIETLAALRPGPITTPTAATKMTMRALARRHQYLGEEIATLNAELDRLTQEVAPDLCALKGVGTDVAGALLVTAGDNPERLRSESSFAHLCGVAPLPASSGKTTGRHRLNRGGNRQANNALWRIVITRLACHQPTKDYVARRTQEGLSKKEIIRCLKRYVAREVFHVLVSTRELTEAA